MTGRAERYERDFVQDPALCERVLQTLPRVPRQQERVIRASRENVDRAIARALSRAVVFCELSRVEIAGECHVSKTDNG
jgi:hypothetical protein